MESSSNQQLAKIASVAALLGLGLAFVAKYFFGGRRSTPKGNWRLVGNVTELFIYPVKSCKGIAVNEGRVTSLGMEETTAENRQVLGDRRMVLYKEDAMEFISARTYPHMLQVSVAVLPGGDLQLEYKGDRIAFRVPSGKPDRKIRLWSETVPLIDCGDEVANWLKDQVFDGNLNVRLGFWPSDNVRRDISHLVAKNRPFFPHMRNEFTGAYSDLSSYLVINEASVDDLKEKVTLKFSSTNNESNELPVVSSRNFRGNIIIRGPAAYEEDTWDWIRIGDDVVFRNFKPCTRCSLTTIDPETSVRNKNLEPITTLKTFRLLSEEMRKLDSSPAMGIYVGLHDEELAGRIIRVGQPVYVSD